MTVAADMDQNPPMTTPTSALPIIKTAKLCAVATTTPDSSINRVRPSSRRPRSSVRVSETIDRLVITAKSPETEIACPATPSVR